MGALRSLLGGEGWAQLEQARLKSQPFAMPRAAGAASERCRWGMLDEALRCDEGDTLVVRGGSSLRVEPPRSLAQLEALFGYGAGIAHRRAERTSDAVRALSAAVAEDVPGEQRAIVFATPARAHGFGWHFDAEQVFILQTEGVKTYYLRQNTVTPKPYEPRADAFGRYDLETSPLLACELRAGDFLYVPSGYWHMGYAHVAALSVSIGILEKVARPAGVS